MKQNSLFLTLGACLGIALWGSAGETILGNDLAVGKHVAGWVDKRVDAWQPTREERAFDEIGWATDLREAERLGKQHKRPVFLFTYDGASLSGYRC